MLHSEHHTEFPDFLIPLLLTRTVFNKSAIFIDTNYFSFCVVLLIILSITTRSSFLGKAVAIHLFLQKFKEMWADIH